jgi:hypothetical protein
MPRDPEPRARGVLAGPIAHVDHTARVLTIGRVDLHVPESIDLERFRAGVTVTVTYERHGPILRAVAIRLGPG